MSSGTASASSADTPPVVVEDRGSARWIWFNRPRVHNAQDMALLQALDTALDNVERDPGVRVVVLAGKGTSFCSGHDLKQSGTNPAYRASQSTAEGRYRLELRWFVGPVERIRRLPVPVICRVQGYCLAAGLMFVDAADLVVATPDAVFGSPILGKLELNDAEVPTLARSVGIRKAKQLHWLGERLSAPEALAYGLVNWVVPAEEIDGHVDSVASKLAEVSSETLELSKASYRFLESRQGWDDFGAYHYMAHQLSHHTSAAQALYRSRLESLAEGRR